jgi:ferritin-like metal-binding protein YciE/predicted ester cyclase
MHLYQEHTMARPDPILTNWLRSAYSMEIGLIPVLEKQVTETGDNKDLHDRLYRHLDQTRRHADLIKGCLDRVGEPVKDIKPATPVFRIPSRAEGKGKGDGALSETYQKELIDFANESFEVTSYRVLQNLAEQVGDRDTARVVEQILRDETDMASWLDKQLPNGMTGRQVETPAAGAHARIAEEPTRIAQEIFDALNEHNIDRLMEHFPARAQTELSTEPEILNREQGRDWVQRFLTAFPDAHFAVMRTLTDGNFVTVQCQVTGTHTGPLTDRRGQTVPATHQKISTRFCSILEVRNGKAPHQWIYVDNGLIMQQLGVMQSPGQMLAGEARSQTTGRRQTTVTDHQRLVQDNFDAVNAHDIDRWESQLSEDYRGEAPGITASSPMDKHQNRAYLENFIQAFPDLRFEMTRTVAEGNQVVVDWTATGTHKGQLTIPGGEKIHPTQRKITQYGSTTLELRGDKIVRSWVYYDMSVLMDQLGLARRR